MENENILFGDLLYERADDMSVLSNFNCGISAMDDFIHNSLQQAIEREGLDTYFVKKENEVLAVFSICDHTLRTKISSGEYVYYDTIEIEYLAVRQSDQRNGLGKRIIELIVERMMHGRNMLSVSAYIDIDTGYTAEPFYKECGFRRVGRPLHALADNVRMIRFL